MARLEEVDNTLVHEDESRYKLRLWHPESSSGSGYERGEWIEMVAINTDGVSVSIDFTRQAFREWLELMQEWVAGWPK